MRIGYARVSSTDQSLDIQLEQLKAAGCEKVFSERVSGSTTDNREELKRCLEFARDGDTLLVTRLDRIARSSRDLHNIVHQLQSKKVDFKSIQQGEIDTTTSTGKLMISMLGAIAEFERDINLERQREGIAKAQAAGRYKGRKPSIDPLRVRELADGGMGPSAIARELGCHRQSVHRLLNDPS